MNAKKVLLSVVAIALILSVVSIMGFAADANPYDVNGDGKVSLIDAKWVLESVVGLRDLTPTDATEATAVEATESTAVEATADEATDSTADAAATIIGDVNGDGKVSVLDAKLILQYIVDATESTAVNA